MSETKISVEEASNMSLDDYIVASGQNRNYNRKYKNQKYKNHKTDNGSEVMDITDLSTPHASSIQWRLTNPNRPDGCAPLVPISAPQKRSNHANNLKHRIRRYRQPNVNRNGINGNRKTDLLLPLQNAMPPNFLANFNGLSNSLVPLNGSVNQINALNEISNSLGVVGSQQVSSGLGYLDMAKMLIEKLDEVRQRNQPKYNMQIQKEISEIQGKTLYFTCSSGGTQSVVSFDGLGVNDCNVKVNSTNVSMNQRFA